MIKKNTDILKGKIDFKKLKREYKIIFGLNALWATIMIIYFYTPGTKNIYFISSWCVFQMLYLIISSVLIISTKIPTHHD
jgi:hypothetical protein